MGWVAFAAARGRLRRCRASAMSRIAFVAAPRIRPRAAANPKGAWGLRPHASHIDSSSRLAWGTRKPHARDPSHDPDRLLGAAIRPVPEYLGPECLDPCAMTPGVRVEARFAAGLLEEFLAAPVVLNSDLRQQEPPSPPRGDDEPILSHDDFADVAHLTRLLQDGDLDLEIGQIVPPYRREARVLRGRGGRAVPHRAAERLAGLDDADAAAQVPPDPEGHEGALWGRESGGERAGIGGGEIRRRGAGGGARQRQQCPPLLREERRARDTRFHNVPILLRRIRISRASDALASSRWMGVRSAAAAASAAVSQ